MENIVLSPIEIALVTGGKWENLTNDTVIGGVNYHLPYLKEGDLFVTMNPEQWSSKTICNEHRYEEFFEKGASAIIVRDTIKIETNKPVLKVENTKKAMKDIAMASSHFANVKRVAVTGTEGKTNFKFQLFHMIKDQLNTHVQLDSANMDLPIWQNLSNIKPSHELAIVEIAIPAKNVGPLRSKYVKPDICIVTEIGFEHLVSHGSVEELIKNKVSICQGLSANGICILNGDNQFFEKAKAEVQRLRPDVKIVSFGHEDFNQTQIIEKKFINNNWEVKIRIKDKEFKYTIPLVEDFAPINSLMVLSTVHYLGLDIEKSIKALQTYKPFQTHGMLYSVESSEKSFLLYDQSYRGKYQPFISFFKTIKKLEAKGRRILIMSQIVDERDFDFFDFNEFLPLFEEANIDILYTVDKFKTHEHIVPKDVKWEKHAQNYSEIIDQIVQDVQKDDIIFIKGVHSSGVYKIAQKLKSLGKVI